MSATEIEQKPVLDDGEPGDHDRFAHIIGGLDGKAALMEALVMGTEVEALCGKRWVPHRNPDDFAVCPDCIKVYETIMGKPWKGLGNG